MVDATFLCSTCATYFNTDAQRREHMSTEWHVYNMRRRVAELPPVSHHLYDTVLAETRHKPKVEDSTREVDDIEYEESTDRPAPSYPPSSSSSNDCLFCLHSSADIDESLQHMSAAHSFTIPDQDQLETDIDTLLAYLSLVINTYHSCLFCGHEKSSAEAVRAHMLAKGHCMLDLGEGSEFLDFWEDTDQEEDATRTVLSRDEVRLQSGAIVSSRHNGRPNHKPPRLRPKHNLNDALIPTVSTSSSRPTSSLPDSSSSSSRPTKALITRDQLGTLGLTTHQQHALTILSHKQLSRSQRTMNEARWVVEKFGNKTKQARFKPDTPGRKNG